MKCGESNLTQFKGEINNSFKTNKTWWMTEKLRIQPLETQNF